MPISENVQHIIYTYLHAKMSCEEIGKYNYLCQIASVKNAQACLYGACKGGNYEIVKMVLKKVNLFKALFLWKYVCFSKKDKIVDLLLNEHDICDFDVGLFWACRLGYVYLINKMIEMGAENFNECLKAAGAGGHIIPLMILMEHGADDWNKGLEGACYGHHKRFIEFMIYKGANNWDLALEMSVIKKYSKKLIQFLIKKGATNLNGALATARAHNNTRACKLLMEYGAN